MVFNEQYTNLAMKFSRTLSDDARQDRYDCRLQENPEESKGILFLQYIYGTFFGIFTYDLPYNVDTRESREDEGSISTVQNSETTEEVGSEKLQKQLEKISKQNDERIQKAILSNQKRIELLTKETDEYVRKLVEFGERFHESFSLETDKFVKISTAEVDENLKLSAAFNEQRVQLDTAVEGKNFRRDLIDYIHKKRLELLKCEQKIESQFTAEYKKLNTAALNRSKILQSMAVRMDKE
ncbi:hypothetical protein TNCV_351331 [Trichonephila clavipes]|nr:hypothetical protein TNCV_351331 [Trichonephila clavipes]